MHVSERGQLKAWLVGSGVIAVGMGVMNLGTYGFTVLAARFLGPSEYGALAALMGLLLVVNVVSLGLQATGARRVAAAPQELVRHEREILSASYRSALVLGALCLAAVPAVASLLRLDSWLPAALIAVTAVPLTVMGGQAGVLQGERRWLPLAGIYLMVGLGRIAFGVVTMLVAPSALGAMVGVTIGAFAPTVVGWFAIRHRSRQSERGPAPPRERRVLPVSWARGSLFREVALNSHALLAFFALSNADVVIARVVLSDHDSGLYAGGLILAKAVLFLPQFVVVIAFPSMSEAGARRSTHLKGLGMVLAIGALATAGAWLLAPLAITFIGGSAYADLEPLIWAFACIGTVLAMNQLMVYNVVARQEQRMVSIIWGGLVALVATAPVVGSVVFLVTVVLVIQTSVLLILLGLSLRRTAPDPAEAGQPA